MLLQCKELTKSFGGVTALDGLTLTVGKGKILGLIGPNGSGKTTFFNLVTGIYHPDSGTITFNEKNITGLRPHCIARMGVGRTFQVPAPFSKMTVLENVMVGTFIHASSIRMAKEKAQEILEVVRLGQKADQQVLRVTLEDRKRLELARALATEPTLLLLDEVMAGLTPTEVTAAVELIRTLQYQGRAMVIIEHVMDVILSLCDHVVVLDHGKKIAEDSPDRIVNDKEVIQAYLGEHPSARH